MYLSKNKIILFTKLSINLFCFTYIYSVFDNKKYTFESFFGTYFNHFGSFEILILILATFLVLANWSLEALKIYYFAIKLEKIKFSDVLKSVAASVSIGLFTPQIIGDIFSKKYYLSDQFQSQSITILFLSRTAQFLITVFFGTLAYICFWYLKPIHSTLFNPIIIICIITLSSFIFITLFLKISPLKINSWFQKYFNFNGSIYFFNQLTWFDHVINLLLSWFRYGVFTCQYLLLLFVFGVDITKIEVIFNVWLTFFVKSILPTLNFFNELGVREATAMYFFDKTNTDLQAVVLASMLLWIINILMPSIIGLYVINFSKTKK